MKRQILIVAALVIAATSLVWAGDRGKTKAKEQPLQEWISFDHPKLVELLGRINSVDAFTKPNLEVRKDENYAGTTVDVEPFGGTRPYNEFFLKQMEYTGPGRAEPEPENLDTVKIGFIGPIMSTVSVATGGKSHEETLGIPMLQGARLALEQWNERGGYLKRKLPFELVVSNDNGLWGASGNEIIKQNYKDKVWAMIGTIDGANSHIAIRVALKCELVMMNTGDTDPTFIETNIPWVMRNIGDDRQQSYLLVDYAYRKMGYQKIGIIRASNRYGRFGVREIRDSARRMGKPVPVEMAYKVGQEDFALELERLKKSGADAIVHWGNAVEGAKILNQMRAMGMRQPYLACDRCVQPDFARIAGKNAEGVVCGYPWNPKSKEGLFLKFREAYRARYGQEPETYASHAYDGMNMVIWAIQVAGLNRAKIRDVLAYLPEPWPGVTGQIQFSACLDDVGDVYLAEYKDGDWHYHSRSELAIPKGYVPPRDRLNRAAKVAQR